ncbi:HAD family hydrolase [Geosporobacter subterraneus]|uniref:HAD family hydrolase n=1 Tax=Geosporobacter subterraneus TaxID=390806 RepID=UPI001675EC7A|nr:HAD hydrolase-like protein [Geosporobacter subterraneus]
MQNTLLIWDIDGTLIHSNGCGRRAMDRAFFQLFGIKDGFQDIEMSGRLDAWIVRDALSLHHIRGFDLDLFFDTYCKILAEEMSSINAAVSIGGINDFFQQSKAFSHVYHALGTGNIERGARIKLAPQGLNPYLPVGGFGDAALERWQIIEQAIDRSKDYYKVSFQTENIYVIGDTPLDIGCGKAIGVKTIAVATGSHDIEELRKHEPDYLFANLGSQSGFLHILEAR